MAGLGVQRAAGFEPLGQELTRVDSFPTLVAAQAQLQLEILIQAKQPASRGPGESLSPLRRVERPVQVGQVSPESLGAGVGGRCDPVAQVHAEQSGRGAIGECGESELVEASRQIRQVRWSERRWGNHGGIRGGGNARAAGEYRRSAGDDRRGDRGGNPGVVAPVERVRE